MTRLKTEAEQNADSNANTSLITDKQFYLDGNLKKIVDLCIERHRKGWDNVIIIDGKERAGKSTLAKTIAYYYAWATGKTFNIDNVFFDPEKMLEYAVNNRDSVIVWDECAFGGLSVQWQNKIQQKLNSMLMVTGKYHHLYIFIIPSFFRLNKYLALDRSIALLHVYSPDLVKRGLFSCFNERQKLWIYNSNKKSEMYASPTFTGRFTLAKTDTILDEAEYERKKDKAIQDFVKKEQDAPLVTKLKWFIGRECKLNEAMELFGISRGTYFVWKALDPPNLARKREEKDRETALLSSKSGELVTVDKDKNHTTTPKDHPSIQKGILGDESSILESDTDE